MKYIPESWAQMLAESRLRKSLDRDGKAYKLVPRGKTEMGKGPWAFEWNVEYALSTRIAGAWCNDEGEIDVYLDDEIPMN